MNQEEFIKNIKKAHKLNNKEIGGMIGISGDALRMAAKRNSLTVLQVKEIERLFDEKQIKSSENKQKDLPEQVNELMHKVIVLELENKHLNREVEHLKEIDELRAESMARYKMDVSEIKDEIKLLKELREEIKNIKRLG